MKDKLKQTDKGYLELDLIKGEEVIYINGVPKTRKIINRVRTEETINLGSIKNPNKEILKIKIVVPKDKERKEDFINFFRGFGI